LIGRIRSGNLRGLNVTIPHKQTAIQFVDELTPTATAIGAVNTLYSRDNKIIGDNTDAAGFLKDLERFMPIPASALVLGAGGGARAIVHALRAKGCSTSVAARRPEQAEGLARQFVGVRAISMTVDALSRVNAELVINATSAGMSPTNHGCAWPDGLAFPKGAAVYDLIYSPPATRLIRSARAAGLRATNGLGMLIEQAAMAFELWTGVVADRQLLVDTIQQRAG
ncbi:MAG: shikimate dehydrogenase family protein, partial [Anaerolineae bacterium]